MLVHNYFKKMATIGARMNADNLLVSIRDLFFFSEDAIEPAEIMTCFAFLFYLCRYYSSNGCHFME